MDYVIIVAGGKGIRMGSDIPKQFLRLGGRPVLMHTIEQFHRFDTRLNIILVLPHEQQEYWRELCREHGFNVLHHIVDGGESRFFSSFNGLNVIADSEQGLAGIHDGVRPFPSHDTIRRCYEAARQHGAAIPVVPVTDTLRHISADDNGDMTSAHNVSRDNYRIVQTPQVFDIQLVKKAFSEALCQQAPAQHADIVRRTSEAFTDDASVVEALGHPVCMVEGNRENIKITTPTDLIIAETLLKA